MRLHEIEARDIKQVKTAIDFALEKYRRNKIAIYKGSDNYGTEQGVFYRDPTAHAQPRISANTQNYTTLWVDGDPRWLGFPPRSRSLICTTDPATAGSYGDIAAVIPLQDTKVGVCPKPDFWDSFSETMPSQNSIVDLNSFINMGIKRQLGRVIDQRSLTRKELIEILDALNPNGLENSRVDQAFVGYVQRHGWRGMMDAVLDPGANEFRLTTWRQFNVTGDHEVWLSAPCAMIGWQDWQSLTNDKIDLDTLLGQD
jgi:hypothetical protein